MAPKKLVGRMLRVKVKVKVKRINLEGQIKCQTNCLSSKNDKTEIRSDGDSAEFPVKLSENRINENRKISFSFILLFCTNITRGCTGILIGKNS